jgi:hypothetical protein
VHNAHAMWDNVGCIDICEKATTAANFFGASNQLNKFDNFMKKTRRQVHCDPLAKSSKSFSYTKPSCVMNFCSLQAFMMEDDLTDGDLVDEGLASDFAGKLLFSEDSRNASFPRGMQLNQCKLKHIDDHLLMLASLASTDDLNKNTCT